MTPTTRPDVPLTRRWWFFCQTVCFLSVISVGGSLNFLGLKGKRSVSSNFSASEPSSMPPSKTPIFQTNYPGRCMALFGFFVVLGCLFLGIMARDFIREWRANNVFVEDTCVVVGKEVRRSRPGAGHWLRISIKYAVNGQEVQATTYSSNSSWPWSGSEAQAILARFEIGREYPCWYDPDDPAKVVVVRGDYRWGEYRLGLIPLAIVVVFGLGMYACWLRLRQRPTPMDAATDRPIS